MATQEGARRSQRSAESGTAASSLQLALIQFAEGRLQQAEEACSDALRHKRLIGERDAELATILNTRAAILLERGATTTARENATEAVYALAGVVGNDRQRVRALILIGRSHVAEERYTEARPLFDRALAICQRTCSEEECRVLVELAGLCRQAGNMYEAEDNYRQALDIAEKLFGVNHPEVATICHRLALLSEAVHDPGSLERYARRAHEIRSSALGSTHPLTAAAQAGLASVLESCGEDAGERYLHALAIFDRQYALPSLDRSAANEDLLRDYAFCLRGACRKLLADGRTDDVHEFSSRAQRVFERFLGKHHPLVKNCRKEHHALLRAAHRGIGHKLRYSVWEWCRNLSNIMPVLGSDLR